MRRALQMSELDDNIRERFRNGDEVAFRELVERFEDGLRPRIERQIPAGLKRRIAPSDVIQETCILAFARREDFEDRGEGSFGAWLRAIADRKLQEEIRRHNGASKRSAAREVTRGARPDTGHFHGRDRTPSVAAMLSEDTLRVRRAIGQLPSDYQTVIHLALDRGLPLREVAEEMGRSREAAKKLYGRAVVRLRQLVDGLSDDA
jgi:RNA polymerase sigma-70 factor (ECF subfamily)